MIKNLLLVAIIIFSQWIFSQASLEQFLNETDAFMKKYVREGNVDYAAIKKGSLSLDALYSSIGNMELTGKTDNEIKAFYINSYNILVIYQVVHRLPITGPLEVDGFFSATPHKVAGKELTLDQLEKETLLIKYPDPRIHFAVVCAALGCPQLTNYAYKPEYLDKQLDVVTSKSLNRDYFIRIRQSQQKVEISKIFEWYRSDFGENNILTFINKYRDKKIPESFEIVYYEYDWNLNQVK